MNYITSDLHFYHNKILEFCPDTRPFTSLEQMHESYIKEINRLLTPKDAHMYFLGDFSFKGKEATRQILNKLPCGKITMIMGNHDRHHKGLYTQNFRQVVDYLEVNVSYEWLTEKVKICMMHFPIESWNRKNHGAVHMHGHSHSDFVSGNRRRDVGIDGQGRIYTLEEVVRDALQDEVVKNHHAD